MDRPAPSKVDILSTSPQATVAFAPSPRASFRPSSTAAHQSSTSSRRGEAQVIVPRSQPVAIHARSSSWSNRQDRAAAGRPSTLRTASVISTISMSPSDGELTFDNEAYLNGHAARHHRPVNPLVVKHKTVQASPMPFQATVTPSQADRIEHPKLREGELLQMLDETLEHCGQLRSLGDVIEERIQGTRPGPFKLIASPVLNRRSMFQHSSPDAVVINTVTSKTMRVTPEPMVRFQPKAAAFVVSKQPSAFTGMDMAPDA
eukprot:TRINITY_DN5344_c0_g1_i1.p1 TRINITY_DN5344_c0_g1~~TRINITY_DN5344_c0_g1_i1.p1  ORF type:complete len:260 (+),score=32.52 TRINITY_DN5344_c0_g1_i1:289-1068(+)